MLIRLEAKHRTSRFLDYDLVDVLRAISRQDYSGVLGRKWFITELSVFLYDGGGGFESVAFQSLFRNVPLVAGVPVTVDSIHFLDSVIVEGTYLLERSALIHQVESGYFLRIVDPVQPVMVTPGYSLANGPSTFQATNVDLEIRCDEDEGLFIVVTEDEALIEYLQSQFAQTVIER